MDGLPHAFSPASPWGNDVGGLARGTASGSRPTIPGGMHPGLSGMRHLWTLSKKDASLESVALCQSLLMFSSQRSKGNREGEGERERKGHWKELRKEAEKEEWQEKVRRWSRGEENKGKEVMEGNY